MAPNIRAAHSGSLADVPRDLLAQINELEQLFGVDQQKLKEITNQFVSELERGTSLLKEYYMCKNINQATTGLSVEGGTIVSVERYYPMYAYMVVIICSSCHHMNIAHEPYLGHGLSHWS